MKKLLFTVFMSFGFTLAGDDAQAIKARNQMMDIFKIYCSSNCEIDSETDCEIDCETDCEIDDALKAITKLDASCCNKINALSEEDYKYIISNIVTRIVYFSQIDLLIEGSSEREVENSYRYLNLFNKCRPIGEIISTIYTNTNDHDEKVIIQEVKSKIISEYQ